MARQESPAPGSRKFDSLQMVWSFARHYPGRIAAAIAALIASSAATMAIPNGFRLVIDKGFSAEHGGDIGRWFQYLLAVVVILAVATSLRFYFVSWLGERVVADIRIAVQRNLLRLSPSYFEENRPAEITSRITSDTTLIEQLVGTTISLGLRNSLTGLAGITYLFYIAPKLAAMMLLIIPIVIVPIRVIGKRLRAVARSSQDRVADVGTIISEVLSSMKIVQAFGQQQREGDRFERSVETAFGTARKRVMLRALLTVIVIGLIFGSITFIMWQGALDVQAGRITGGTIAAFVLTGALVAGSLGTLAEVYGDIVRGAGAASRLAELLAQQPTIAPPAHPVALPSPPRGEIAFDHVSFRYPTRLEQLALEDFSLSVRPGETVAIVGPSGAGKSTLFQLLQRFYDPESGTISVDGVALKDADPEDIRCRIAMVPQETVLFAASARDNLRYGHWDADDAALWAAAESANAADFLRELPDGLDTFMGEGGARLSGGQRQRIAIARALLRNAPILLLDEATSALDAESERLIQDALDRLIQNRTTLVIAHRLATIRSADRIIVMDRGRIVETGTHDSLIALNGTYARLARLQFDGIQL
ncbi:ABC transporter transmembrane domain-containing protein [Aquisediminimonas sediminicola]|uniref:ABC transporter transmembrane domain-containing protein n=1 Tax=Alteraquisediminimonas sediminicola TaxID=2676787 RepID=UPI001C8E8908|nr:ABC transporter transmembrane domain-containing protein [Aquisediminimonas sediminicola]